MFGYFHAPHGAYREYQDIILCGKSQVVALKQFPKSYFIYHLAITPNRQKEGFCCSINQFQPYNQFSSHLGTPAIFYTVTLSTFDLCFVLLHEVK